MKSVKGAICLELKSIKRVLEYRMKGMIYNEI